MMNDTYTVLKTLAEVIVDSERSTCWKCIKKRIFFSQYLKSYSFLISSLTTFWLSARS